VAKTVVTGMVVQMDRIIERGMVVVEGGKICHAGKADDYTLAGDETHLDYTGQYIIPGMIDLHVHGSAGYDVMDGTAQAIREIGKSLCRYGVTGFLATTMTAPWDQIVRALEAIAEAATGPLEHAQLLGVHLEGPWINPKHKGAQKEEDIQQPAREQVEAITGVGAAPVRMVTLAPEMPGVMEAIAELVRHNVICSIGHSDATWEQVKQAVAVGASHFTHLFNAMRGLHHREPGVVGAALQMRQCSCDIIADFVHVHPAAVELVYHNKGREKLLLISDGMRAVGMGDGTFELGGQTVHVRGCIARLDSGTLAGSTLTLDQAVKNLVEKIGIPVADAVYMASTAPAKKLGIADRKGSLEAGKDADLAVLSGDFRARMTMVNGNIVYREDGEPA
jgi:N-acetylglucosamine-6-phosphate deacetylase